MNSDYSGIRIPELKDSNYHSWKIRIIHVLTLKGLKKYITDNSPVLSDDSSNADVVTKWKENDEKTQAVIGLTLSDELLENVRDVSSAK